MANDRLEGNSLGAEKRHINLLLLQGDMNDAMAGQPKITAHCSSRVEGHLEEK